MESRHCSLSGVGELPWPSPLRMLYACVPRSVAIKQGWTRSRSLASAPCLCSPLALLLGLHNPERLAAFRAALDSRGCVIQVASHSLFHCCCLLRLLLLLMVLSLLPLIAVDSTAAAAVCTAAASAAACTAVFGSTYNLRCCLYCSTPSTHLCTVSSAIKQTVTALSQ